MNLKYRINSDHVLLFGRWIPRMAVVDSPGKFSFYGWRYLHVFLANWAKFLLTISRAWLRSKEK